MSNYYYLPKGSVTRKTFINKNGIEVTENIINYPPHMQSRSGSYEYFIIPTLDRDLVTSCCSSTDICFKELNVGYKCKKHRI